MDPFLTCYGDEERQDTDDGLPQEVVEYLQVDGVVPECTLLRRGGGAVGIILIAHHLCVVTVDYTGTQGIPQ